MLHHLQVFSFSLPIIDDDALGLEVAPDGNGIKALFGDEPSLLIFVFQKNQTSASVVEN